MAKKSQKYWRNKIDKFLREHARNQPCALCNSIPAHYHHLLPKSRYACYRAEPMNLILLCPTHHTFSCEIAPHSQSYRAVVAFGEWLEKNRPKQHKWVVEHEHHREPSSKIDYEELYNNLLETLK